MSHARHRQKRPVARPRLLPVVIPVAAIALVVSGSAGVSSSPDHGVAGWDLTASASTRAVVDRPSRGGAERAQLLEKSPVAVRGAAETVVAKALRIAGTRYVTSSLNVRTGPGEQFATVKVLDPGSQVAVTGESDGVWAQMIYKNKPRWVKSRYLSKKKPTSAAIPGGGAISGAPCASGSSVESGLRPNTIKVHRAVCATFPQVGSYGGLRGDGEHSMGQALDIMVGSDSSLGDQISAWVRTNAGRLGVSEVIWSQHIWTTQRSGEGWRPMPDRGSPTANHYDHVHVTTQ